MANNASIANFGGDNIVYSSAGSASLIDIGADALLSGITATQLAGGH